MKTINISSENLGKASGICIQISEALHALNDVAFINGLPGTTGTTQEQALEALEWMQHYSQLCLFVISQCGQMAEDLANKLDSASVGKGDYCQDQEEDQATV